MSCMCVHQVAVSRGDVIGKMMGVLDIVCNIGFYSGVC